MNPLKLSLFIGFSSLSSSSNNDDDEQIIVLVTLYDTNNAARLEILRKEAKQSNKHGSFVPRRKYYHCKRKRSHDQLFTNYFAANPIYLPPIFRRHFGMNRPLFLHILNAIGVHNPYFVQKIDACNFIKFSTLQKMTTAMKMLAYGTSADALNKYL